MLLLPISALLQKASLVPLATFWARATEPVALSAYYVTFTVGLAAAAVNCVFGFLLAWVLTKYNFPGVPLDVQEGGACLHMVHAERVAGAWGWCGSVDAMARQAGGA